MAKRHSFCIKKSGLKEMINVGSAHNKMVNSAANSYIGTRDSCESLVLDMNISFISEDIDFDGTLRHENM